MLLQLIEELASACMWNNAGSVIDGVFLTNPQECTLTVYSQVSIRSFSAIITSRVRFVCRELFSLWYCSVTERRLYSSNSSHTESLVLLNPCTESYNSQSPYTTIILYVSLSYL